MFSHQYFSKVCVHVCVRYFLSFFNFKRNLLSEVAKKMSSGLVQSEVWLCHFLAW